MFDWYLPLRVCQHWSARVSIGRHGSADHCGPVQTIWTRMHHCGPMPTNADPSRPMLARGLRVEYSVLCVWGLVVRLVPVKQDSVRSLQHDLPKYLHVPLKSPRNSLKLLADLLELFCVVILVRGEHQERESRT